MWLSVEKRTTEEVATMFGKVDKYHALKHNGFLEEIMQKEKDFPYSPEDIWVISDDTIFSLAGMKSITEKAGIDLVHLFQTHKSMFDEFGPYWFGEMTREKFKQLSQSWDLSILTNRSWGNGIMMKQFPYAAYFKWNADDDNQIDNDMEAIAEVTHDSAIAKLTAIVHNKALIYLLDHTPQNFNPKLFLHYLYNIAALFEERYTFDESNDLDMRITPIIKKLMAQQQSIEAGKPYTLQQIADEYYTKIQDPALADKPMKWGFHVATTFGFVYANFLQDRDWNWLLQAVNIGYDADSQWAVIGNMIGALNWPFYDQKFVDDLRDKAYIQNTLDQFLKALDS